ncbi:hypothetical protein [Actinocrispum sp. NPDC049592]|uniref:hypothetical protein n=1 Tax=Actinocrispum sp. NPDC049592 TaxID=3154835 RepID=UPI003445B644
MGGSDPLAVPGRYVGTVYLLHFDRPYRHARHYIGWAKNVTSRLALHDAGQGARLLQVVRAEGITWTLARTWPGTRLRERQIKRMGGAARRCPLCGVRPRPDRVRLDSRLAAAYRLRALTDQWWDSTDPAERDRLTRETTALEAVVPPVAIPGAITALAV